MSKVRIAFATLGSIPTDLDLQAVLSTPSEVFEFTGTHHSYALRLDADDKDWQYTDQALSQSLPEHFDADLLFAVTRVPLSKNWYARRLEGNRVVFSFHEIAEVMRNENIPLANPVVRMIYASALVYMRYDSAVPMTGTNMTPFTHDETRGCLFDMNPMKADLTSSCVNPIICDECVERLRGQRVPVETIRAVQNEIGSLNKTQYFRIADWIRRHPIFAAVISVCTAFAIGVLSSIAASLILQRMSR